MSHVQNADTAILFIHGILGKPDYFNPFLPLVPSCWTIENILLKGHGGSVRDLAAASMAEWKQQVHGALSGLRANHAHVYITAHSMGTLFAIQEAIDAPVDGLFLLNVPLKIHVRLQLLKTVWRIFRGTVPADDPRMLAAQNACGVTQDPHIWRYLGWIPQYLALFAEIGRTRKMVSRLTAPCQAYLSMQDEMVSPAAGRILEQNACVRVQYLPVSGHFYYAPEELQLLQREFCGMMHTGKPKNSCDN